MLINPFVNRAIVYWLPCECAVFHFMQLPRFRTKRAEAFTAVQPYVLRPSAWVFPWHLNFHACLYWPDEKEGGNLCKVSPRRLGKENVWGCHRRNTGSQGAVLRELRFFKLAGFYNLLGQINVENSHFQRLGTPIQALFSADRLRLRASRWALAQAAARTASKWNCSRAD